MIRDCMSALGEMKMPELSAEKLAYLREIAEAASPGPWKQWNPAMGPSHITIGGKVAFESLQSATRFADDEVIQHWCDAAHIAAVDPPTVLALLDLIAEQQAELAKVREYAEAMVSNDMSGWDLMAKLVGDGSIRCARGILAVLDGDGDE